MRSGYAGVENPLFWNPKRAMLFGDTKASVIAITEELEPLLTPSGTRAPTPA